MNEASTILASQRPGRHGRIGRTGARRLWRWRRGREPRGIERPERTGRLQRCIHQRCQPSDKKGGTLKFANPGDWDTLDPGETYYA